MQAHLKPECWREWRGPEFGNEGGRTAAWGAEHAARWLKKLNPEVAVILFGTNDLRDVSILAQEAETTWTVLYQGGKELHDDELLSVSSDAREHAKRVLRCIRT